MNTLNLLMETLGITIDLHSVYVFKGVLANRAFHSCFQCTLVDFSSISVSIMETADGIALLFYTGVLVS